MLTIMASLIVIALFFVYFGFLSMKSRRTVKKAFWVILGYLGSFVGSLFVIFLLGAFAKLLWYVFLKGWNLL